jgi:uncharacterized membrane protein
MTDRTQETHAAPIDLPLTLFGIGLGADVLGRIVGSAKLQAMARYIMPAAATAAALAAAGGLVDTQDTPDSGPARDADGAGFSTFAMAGAAAALAAWRWRRERASVPYLALGLAAIGAVASNGRGAARRLERDADPERAESPKAPRETATAHVAAALRTEAADRLRGL